MTTETDAPKEDAPFYCPGCGKRYNFQTICTVHGAPPIEVVSTQELSGPPEDMTACPSTADLG